MVFNRSSKPRTHDGLGWTAIGSIITATKVAIEIPFLLLLGELGKSLVHHGGWTTSSVVISAMMIASITLTTVAAAKFLEYIFIIK
jgi:hypothetical protein